MKTKLNLAAVLFIVACFSNDSSVIAGTSFTLQAGAFSNRGDAQAYSVGVRAAGFDSVSILEEETGTKGIFYKVLAGSFSARSEADTAKLKLESQGIDAFVRVNASFDSTVVKTAIEGSAADYFSSGSELLENNSQPEQLVAGLPELRRQSLSGPTTAPETLRAFADYIRMLPDTNPGKGKEIVMLGHRTFSGKRAYSGNNYSFEPAKGLLIKTANGEIASSMENKLEAREMIAHILHYYDRAYIDALTAYRQIRAEYRRIENVDKVGEINKEIASTSYELAKQSAYDLALLEPVITELWKENIELQNSYSDTSSTSAVNIRKYTLTIGLMLSEILLNQDKWQEVDELTASLDAIFSDYQDCQLLLVESLCHRAEAGINLDNLIMTNDATTRGMKMVEKQPGILWGDSTVDVAFKIHVWRLAMLQKFQYPDSEQAAFKAYCYQKFFGHPMAKQIFKN